MKPIRTKILDNGVKIHTIGKLIKRDHKGNIKSRGALMLMCIEKPDKLVFQRYWWVNGKQNGNKKVVTFKKGTNGYNCYISIIRMNGHRTSFNGNRFGSFFNDLFKGFSKSVSQRATRKLAQFGMGLPLKFEIYPALKNFPTIRNTRGVPTFFMRYMKKVDFNEEKMRKLVLKKHRNDEFANKYYDKLKNSHEGYVKLALLARFINAGMDLQELVFHLSPRDNCYRDFNNQKDFVKNTKKILFEASKLGQIMYGN